MFGSIYLATYELEMLRLLSNSQLVFQFMIDVGCTLHGWLR